MVGFRARFPQSWGRIVRPEPTLAAHPYTERIGTSVGLLFCQEWVTPLAAHPCTERIGSSSGLTICQILTGHIPIANSPEHIKQVQ